MGLWQVGADGKLSNIIKQLKISRLYLNLHDIVNLVACWCRFAQTPTMAKSK
jgi:hypothetical protein